MTPEKLDIEKMISEHIDEEISKGAPIDPIYVIKRIWVNPWENQSAEAVGYKTVGYVFTETEAQSICAKGRQFTRKDCWAIGVMNEGDSLPEFIWRIVEHMSQIE